MTKIFARMAAAIGLAPILAPNIGAQLAAIASWRASFYFLVFFGLALWSLVWFFLPETRKPQTAKPNLFRAFAIIGRNPIFVQYTSIYALGFGALFSFISSAAPLLMEGRGISAQKFALFFGSNAVIYMGASYVASKMVHRWSLPHLALIGSCILSLSGMVMWGFIGSDRVWAILVPMYGATWGIAFMMPAGSSGAMQPFPEMAGQASALQGFLRFAAGGLAAYFVSLGSPTHALGLSYALISCGSLSVLAAWWANSAKVRQKNLLGALS